MTFLKILSLLVVLNCGVKSCPKVVSRDEWGGAPALEIYYLNIPVLYVIIHHTRTHRCCTSCADRVAEIQTDDMNGGLYDIGYNFLVGGTGDIFEGVGWRKRAAHTNDYFNNNSISIAFIGNFNDHKPKSKSLNAILDFLECGVDKSELSADYEVYGASQLMDTDSPGSYLYKNIKKWEHWRSV